jgi:hypothetical protein
VIRFTLHVIQRTCGTQLLSASATWHRKQIVGLLGCVCQTSAPCFKCQMSTNITKGTKT